jgi:hypothetical protein
MEKLICDYCKEEPATVVEIFQDGEVSQCCSVCYARESDTGEIY